ncbi:hypothetical protein HPB50_021465 [Hyalomma asiaticum]|uniref:Uncharacterized protein n=1 Tax=Hyalomma asiaticum TaxID=266040 RepID=A0ACB7RW65_HYAAI|nr:hypothetical protein HPB50_021465 [Hyalomma asiaticum]
MLLRFRIMLDPNSGRYVIRRPPSQSLNSYGTADDVRSPTGSAGTPGPMPQQPSSQQSTDNNSEAASSYSAIIEALEEPFAANTIPNEPSASEDCAIRV